ncbi:MAG: hypothetical protein MZU84_07090 [Sphingobacterium sp.]|nr:hypothetical protein [Sphingobacterium sp.]
MSDRTWNRLGRRRPYFLTGAVLASLALAIITNSPTWIFATVMLWIMDASINISMEPFRAFVRRHASVKTANDRFCHAELLHWHRCCHRRVPAMDPCQLVQRSCSTW